MTRSQARNGSSAALIENLMIGYVDHCVLWPFGRDTQGYARAFVSGYSTRLAHRILCEKHHGKPNGAHNVARHTCGNGHLGCVNPQHIVWGTAQDNIDDKIKHGTKPVGAKTGCAILSEDQVTEIRRLRLECGHTYRQLGYQFHVTTSTIQAVIERRTWKHIPLEAYAAENLIPLRGPT